MSERLDAGVYLCRWAVTGASLIGFVSLAMWGSLAYSTGSVDHCSGGLSCPGMMEPGALEAVTWGWSPEIILLELALLLIVALAAPHQLDGILKNESSTEYTHER